MGKRSQLRCFRAHILEGVFDGGILCDGDIHDAGAPEDSGEHFFGCECRFFGPCVAGVVVVAVSVGDETTDEAELVQRAGKGRKLGAGISFGSVWDTPVLVVCPDCYWYVWVGENRECSIWLGSDSNALDVLRRPISNIIWRFARRSQ